MEVYKKPYLRTVLAVNDWSTSVPIHGTPRREAMIVCDKYGIIKSASNEKDLFSHNL